MTAHTELLHGLQNSKVENDLECCKITEVIYYSSFHFF